MHRYLIPAALFAAAVSSPVQAKPLPADPVECLALNLYYEIRGGPLEDQLAVGHVVMNRTRDRRFPTTVCGVIHQRGQFSWVPHPAPIREAKLLDRMRILAREIIAGTRPDPTKGALFFHRPGTRLRIKGAGVALRTRLHLYLR